MNHQIRLGLAAMTVAAGLMAGLSGCSKSEDVQVSAPFFKAGVAISTKTPLSGVVKGTLLADSTYRVTGDVFINEGDTLVVQPGAKVYFDGKGVWSFIVKGSFLSLGSRKNQSISPFRIRLNRYPCADVTKIGLRGSVGWNFGRNNVQKYYHQMDTPGVRGWYGRDFACIVYRERWPKRMSCLPLIRMASWSWKIRGSMAQSMIDASLWR